jgi:alpha-glucosidase
MQLFAHKNLRCGFGLLAVICLAAANVVAEPTTLTVGSAQIEIAPATDHAFRLSVNFADKPHVLPSIFLQPQKNSVAAQTIHDGDWIGIKTSAGELLINSKDAHWLLKDARENIIIPESSMAEIHDKQISWTINRAPNQPIYNYGSGDVSNSLQQTAGPSAVGNGHSVIPYYWSPSGYAALMISENDNHPASWQLSAPAKFPTWKIDGTSADLYLIPAANLYEACNGYAQLTGPPPVPPRWTFGYLQSRFGWKDRAYIEDTLKNFHDRKLPLDAFIFDFEWYTPKLDYDFPPQGENDFKDFDWNPQLFPQPIEQIASLHAHGIHFVGIRKPRLGNSDLLAQFHQKGWISDLASHGIAARNLDFANPQVRSWYADQLQPLLRAGIDGWWDDEGELTFTTYIHWNQAEAEALEKIRPGARLWTLNRAYQPGLQRFGAAVWTGDIHGDWPTFQLLPAHLLNWSLAGICYSACDIGGFFDEENPQLLTRWMQAGIFFPVMRAHSTKEVTPRFPWLFGPQAESAIREALNLRYRLIPFYYSLAHQSYETGIPIMRPLLMEFPNDPHVQNLSDQWLIGRLMPAPIFDPSNKRTVYLPQGNWFIFDSNKMLEGNRTIDIEAAFDEIPLYVRAGTILPLAPPIQHTDELPGGALQLQIYPGQDATFSLVEDDGQSTAYTTGQLRRTTFTWNDAMRKLSWRIEGPYTGADIFLDMNVTVFDATTKPTASTSLQTDGELIIP